MTARWKAIAARVGLGLGVFVLAYGLMQAPWAPRHAKIIAKDAEQILAVWKPIQSTRNFERRAVMKAELQDIRQGHQPTEWGVAPNPLPAPPASVRVDIYVVRWIVAGDELPEAGADATVRVQCEVRKVVLIARSVPNAESCDDIVGAAAILDPAPRGR